MNLDLIEAHSDRKGQWNQCDCLGLPFNLDTNEGVWIVFNSDKNFGTLEREWFERFGKVPDIRIGLRCRVPMITFKARWRWRRWLPILNNTKSWVAEISDQIAALWFGPGPPKNWWRFVRNMPAVPMANAGALLKAGKKSSPAWRMFGSDPDTAYTPFLCFKVVKKTDRKRGHTLKADFKSAFFIVCQAWRAV